ncbi:hypothetical protein Ocin01_13067 [Orchesella cincta]|uniref:Uncharacterized protein n=1 Tax=Orchesella cincta TaxID=48709 RepID=A0A1D2MKS7_ORCCI|nr:hypothetical protein Ocin01_13067 [Orchesella cincta]
MEAKTQNGRKVDDSLITISMLLPEIWEDVFSLLPASDFLTVINACQEWRQLLASRRTSMLLPLVLPVLKEYLPFQTLLHCRSVSKSAKCYIDEALTEYSSPLQYFQRVSCKDEWFQRNKIHQVIETMNLKYDFRDRKVLEKFLAHFTIHSYASSSSNEDANPLLTRHVALSLDLSEDPDEEVEMITACQLRRLLLPNYGAHVSVFTCEIMTGFDHFNFLRLLLLLCHLPNLKVLKVVGSLEEWMEEAEYLRVAEFPDLEQLETLDLEEFTDLHVEGALGPSLFKHYGPQLKTLICSGRLFDATTITVTKLNIYLPNLLYLRVKAVTSGALFKLSKIDWQLECLQFKDILSSDRRLNLGQILQTVNKFGKTLTHLELLVLLSSEQVNRFDPSKMNMMPKLKTLSTTLGNMNTTWFWKFIEDKCQHVRELCLHTDKMVTTNDRELAKRGFRLLPKLTRIVFWIFPVNSDSSHSLVIQRQTCSP